MLGSLHGRQVIVGEQRVLHKLVLQIIGLSGSARSTPDSGDSPGSTSQRVVEQLLFLAAPVLTEQWLTRPLRVNGPGHYGSPRTARMPNAASNLVVAAIFSCGAGPSVQHLAIIPAMGAQSPR
jgi:hypothetical protein